MIQRPIKPDLQNYYKPDNQEVSKFLEMSYDLKTIISKAMNYAFRKGFTQGETYERQLTKYRKQEFDLDDSL